MPQHQAAEEPEKRICTECMGDRYLIKSFDGETEEGACPFCEQEGVDTVPFSDYAERVQPIYEKYVGQAEDVPDFEDESDNVHYMEGGEQPLFVMQEVVGCEPDVAEAIIKHLGDFARHEVADGGFDYYDETSSKYEVQVKESHRYWNLWNRFCDSVKHERRFFNTKAEKFLNAIFDRVLKGKLTSHDKPALMRLDPTERSNVYIYRGRIANTPEAQRRIVASPAKEMGHPPPSSRVQGRMNAAGIAALYGCLEPRTCVAELRALVGATVLVGTFAILQKLRLLDLRAFDKGSMRLSYFDPMFEEQYAYVSFIRNFHNEIRKPILPADEMLEYLPMQVVAEYLATRAKPKLDGVVYSTSLTSNGTNIVLFQKSAVVRPDAASRIFPESEVEVDEMPEFGLFVTLPPAANANDEHGEADASDATLQLLTNRLEAYRVTGISYEMDEDRITFVTRRAPGKEQPY